MAEALEALFPGVKFGIGPAIDEGFYYDVDLGGHKLSDADLAPWKEDERVSRKGQQIHQNRCT
jgi:threonyl-tRNA synthetase